MLKIGEFARLAKVSVKLLRHYHEVGLLEAQAIDAATGYRYYSIGQLATLNRVLVYRSLGFSLREIGKLIGTDTSPDALRDILYARRAALTTRIEAERSRLAEVEARIAQLEREGRPPLYEVSIRSCEPAVALSLRRVCNSYDDVGELLASLRSRVPAHAAVSASGAIWHRCSSRGEVIECEALVFVDRNKGLRMQPTDSVMLPACTVASIVHDDAAQDVHLAYRAAVERATGLGYRVAGPMREIYLGSRAGGASMTEVQFPLAPAGAA